MQTQSQSQTKIESPVQGTCRKMPTHFAHVGSQNLEALFFGESDFTSNAFEARYQLKFGDTLIDANALLGEQLSLTWAGEINCISCGRKTKKSFAQGHCYPCFKSKASCDLCIMQPEKCHFHLGTCREPAWAKSFCFGQHVVYLAYTSGVKVGITRRTQVPTRWLDQGAVAALPVFTTSSRRLAGVVETYFKDFLADKTNWRQMLKSAMEDVDCVKLLETARDGMFSEHKEKLDDAIQKDKMIVADEYSSLVDLTPIQINYPVTRYLEKIKSHNFEKAPQVSGELLGIKGQYLILDTGVLNVRKFTGFVLELSF